MASAYQEKQRREAVRAMFQFVCDALSRPGTDATALNWTRHELFGNNERLEQSPTEKSFQTRILKRLRDLRLFALLPQTNPKQAHYRVLDPNKLLQALEDEDVLSAIIWERAQIAQMEEASSDSEMASPSTAVASTEHPLSPESNTEPSAAEIQGAMLKMLFGLVESMHYIRTRIENIEEKLNRLPEASTNPEAKLATARVSNGA